MPTRKQGTVLTDRLYRDKLKQKMFRLWQNKFEQTQGAHGDKIRALKNIWSLKVHDVKGDINRAFSIWRDESKHSRQQ